MQVWKFHLPKHLEPQELGMPGGAQPLFVGFQDDELCLWALVDPGAPPAARTFALVCTGDEVPEESHYVGSATAPPHPSITHGYWIGSQNSAIHVFEIAASERWPIFTPQNPHAGQST